MKKYQVWTILITVLLLLILIFHLHNNSKKSLSNKDPIEKENIENSYLDSDEALLNRSLEAFNNRQYNLSLRLLNRLEKRDLSKNPSMLSSVYSNKSTCYYRLNEFEECIVYATKSLELVKTSILRKMLIDELMDSYQLTGQFSNCLEVGYKYLEEFKDDKDFTISIYDNLFDAYIDLEDYQKAEEINILLKELDPENVYHYLSTMYLYSFTKDKDFIKSYLEETMELFPNNSELIKFYEHFSE